MHKGRYCKTYLTHSIGIYFWPLHETLRKLQIDFGRTETNVKFQGVSSEKKSSSPLSHARLHNRLQRDLQSWKKYFKGFQSQSFAQSLFIGMPVLISWDVSHFAWDPYKD